MDNQEPKPSSEVVLPRGSTPPPSWWPRLRAWARRNSKGLGVSIVGSLVGGALLLWLWPSAPPTVIAAPAPSPAPNQGPTFRGSLVRNPNIDVDQKGGGNRALDVQGSVIEGGQIKVHQDSTRPPTTGMLERPPPGHPDVVVRGINIMNGAGFTFGHNTVVAHLPDGGALVRDATVGVEMSRLSTGGYVDQGN